MPSEIKPVLSTDHELLSILEQLIQREPIFHRPEFGTTRADFERITHPDFCEIGASGRRYSRQFVLDELDRRRANPTEDSWTATGFDCRKLASNVYLLTYTLLQANVRTTRRTTIWQQSETGWQILFHQGTIVQDT